MNTDTGQIYQGEAFIQAAIERGEPVVPVSEQVVATMRAGQRAQQQEAQQQDQSNRGQRRRAQQKGRKGGPGYTR